MSIKLRRRLFLAILGACSGLALLEITFQIWISLRPNAPGLWSQPLLPTFDGRQGRYVSHPYSAYAYRSPLSTQDYASSTRSVEANFINSEGFRNKEEFSRDHPGTLRILCLGSSTTYGVRNGYTKSYPFFLQQILSAKVSQKVEVINAGLISATTAEHIARLPYKVGGDLRRIQ
jgi:hypothetical protein